MWETFVGEFITKQGYKLVLSGLLNTVIIAVFGLILGILIGSLIAVVKSVPNFKRPFVKVLQKVADLYVLIFRGTPLVVQLLLMHYVLFPAIGLNIPNLVLSAKFAIPGVVFEAIIVYSLNSGAYVSEIMRAGIGAVDKGQLEAGRALGMSFGRTMVSVVLPQAFKNILPTLGNEFISLIKETSVAGFITVVDVTRAFQAIANSTYEYILPYVMLALVYLVLVLIISIGVKLIEKRMRRA